jgi:hypothetical protein
VVRHELTGLEDEFQLAKIVHIIEWVVPHHDEVG